MNEDKEPRRDWESYIEKQIRQAMERGEFDDLPGSGKSLDLGENLYTPEDWRLAFKVLKDAGVAPEWIELDKEIRSERDVLSQWLERQVQWQRERLAKLKQLKPHEMISEHAYLVGVRQKVGEQYRQRATALNKLIDNFNLKAPHSNLHHARIRIEEEVEKLHG